MPEWKWYKLKRARPKRVKKNSSTKKVKAMDIFNMF